MDEVATYFGMREITIGFDENDVPRPLLNGKFLFHVGMLDQGFWPDGIYSAPSDLALMNEIVEQKRLGFNAVRKHVKIEPRRWYYHCDRLGLMVWQDMPSFRQIDNVQFWKEAALHIQQLKFHPSIVQWVVYNEGWGQPNKMMTQKITQKFYELDKTRLVDPLSGVNFRGDMAVGTVIGKLSEG